MKKIITALANPELNINLKKLNEFEIVSDDIQYQDGILEILEEKEVDILILSELLKGENALKELLRKIKQKNKNIKIILLLEKENEEKIQIAKEEKIDKIFFHHKVSIEEMIFNLKEISSEKNIEQEIENLKKLIIEKNNQKNKKEKIFIKLKNKLLNIFIHKNNNIKKEKDKLNNIFNNNIISITGAHGTGKSLISVCLALNLKREKNKILLIDFDLLNQSIHTILGRSMLPKKLIKKQKNNLNYIPKNYHEYILKINSNLDFISGKNIILENEKNDFQKLNIFFEKIKKEYDLILIDTSSECFLDYTKFILEKSNKIIFLTEANLLEIKKANCLLDIYLRQWNIDIKKINIIFNKYNNNSIDEKILKNIFCDFNILGKISFNKNYSLMINKNMKNYFLLKKEKREHEIILKNIFKNKIKNKGGKIYGWFGVKFNARKRYAK